MASCSVGVPISCMTPRYTNNLPQDGLTGVAAGRAAVGSSPIARLSSMAAAVESTAPGVAAQAMGPTRAVVLVVRRSRRKQAPSSARLCSDSTVCIASDMYQLCDVVGSALYPPVQSFVQLVQPICVNDPGAQELLLDRVYRVLQVGCCHIAVRLYGTWMERPSSLAYQPVLPYGTCDSTLQYYTCM